jgi:YD repeat-containing protein
VEAADTTTFSYDAVRKTLSLTNPDSNTTSWSYNGERQAVSQSEVVALGYVPAESGIGDSGGSGGATIATATATYRARHSETVRATGGHKSYSADRRTWIPVDRLRGGHHIPGVSGVLSVVAVNRLPGIHRVYNMTVEEEHVYHVATLGALAHNADGFDNCPEDKTFQTYTKTNPETGEVYSGRTSGYGTSQENVRRQRHGARGTGQIV